MSDLKQIQDRMIPRHLSEHYEEPEELPTDDDLKQQVQKAALPTSPEEVPDKSDPRSEKYYSFPFEYKDARGKLWKGQFTNKILSIHERQQAGVLRSMLGAGQPVQSLDAFTIELNLMVAHMTYSLTEKPQWAENLRNLDDPQLLQALYTEVDSHESFFLGWPSVESASSKKSG